jgi:hypothetical protein
MLKGIKMSDVLQNAQKYRDRLKFEIGKVDDFLSLADKLMKESAAETYTPLTKKIEPAAHTLLTNPAPRTMPSERRDEELPRPATKEATAVKAEATPAPSPNGRASLFRGSFEHLGPERNKDVA